MPSIAGQWEQYRDMYLKDANPVRLRVERQAFYAGALSGATMVTQVMLDPDKTPEQRGDYVLTLADEHSDFIAGLNGAAATAKAERLAGGQPTQ